LLGARSIAEEYEDILRLAQIADEVGFDSFWVSEHHCAADSYLPALPVMLSAVATVTHRIALGMAVALAPFHHPLRFAEDCAVVDQLSRGRLIVGVGSGWRIDEFRAFNIPYSERGQRTEELIQICRAAWDQSHFTFDGDHFSFNDVSITPRPFDYLRLIIGGSGPKALERAGRLGDGFIGSPDSDLNVFRPQVQKVDRAAREAGRDPHRLIVGFHLNAWVSRDGKIDQSIRKAMGYQLESYNDWHRQNNPGEARAIPLGDDSEISRITLAGTPDEVVDQMRPWLAAFPGRKMHVIFKLHYPGLRIEEVEPTVRLFASEVIPALKAITANS
jgi:probable F420-dependent oxidoreductase